jgi:glycosyltransferase involved in cell wall biosynthesis
VLYSYHGRSRQRRDSEAAINPRVRLFPRVGGLNGSKRFTLAKRQLLRQGLGGRLVDVAGVERLFADEWTRCFGAARFDHVVDFSGYSPLWAFLLLAGRARSHTIWLHNDLATDRYKRIDGRQPLRPGLGALFSMYDRFDRLVSVSEALTAVNRAGLARYAPADKFVSARNTVDGERVLRMASDEYVAGMVAERERAARQALAGEPVPHGTFVEPSDGFAGSTPIEQLAVDVAGVTTFVTVGRLSPEKNHRRLIDAFARVHRQEPDTRLIVVGDGPLRGRLAEQITELGLDEAVLLAGHQENPFPVLAHADCFVLSSDYEGQPMVVLEARLLGLPVVCTDFDSVRSAVPAGAGLVVPRTEEGLARGMLAHLAGEVPSAPFDHVGYNRVAIGEFYRAIGATD